MSAHAAHPRGSGAFSQEDFKAQYFLWQLLCIENDVRRARAEATRRRAEAEKADEGLEGVEAEVAAKRKQAAGIHKQRALLERKVAKRRAEMEKKVQCRAFLALPVAGGPCVAWS